MHILIAIQDLSNNENVPLIEMLLKFATQFTSRTDKQTTVLANIGPGDKCFQDRIEDIIAEACVPASLPKVKTRILKGDPVKNILQEEKSGNFDLVIVKDLPNHGLGRFFRGSKAVRIAERALCPVLIVKGKTGPIQHILMCDSGSPESPLLGAFTARVVDLLPGEQDVTILHVMSQISAGPEVQGEQLRANADELIETHSPEGDLLERDLDSLDQPGLHPVPKIRHGMVVDEIMAETRSGDYDLIIIGVFRQKWQRLLLTDLSRQIIEQTDRPVLIVK